MSGLGIARDILDKGEYYFPVTQLQKTGFHPVPFPCSFYLLFHFTNSCQTWYPQKALNKENPAMSVMRHGDEFPSRTSEITRMAPFGSNSEYCHLPNEVPFLLDITPHSTNVLNSTMIWTVWDMFLG